MSTTTPGRVGPAARRRLTSLLRPLAALGLLATAGAAQAQTPTFGVSTYSTGSASTTGYNNPYDVLAADVNRDGRPDLLVANSTDNSVGVLLGTGTGTFQAASTYSAGGNGNNPVNLTVGDLNGDGNPDLVTGNTGRDQITVFLGNGNGTFQTAVSYSPGANSRPQGVALADVNGDGRLDILTANSSLFSTATSSAGVLLGNGNGTFQAAVNYPTGAGTTPYRIAVADVNGDGRLDLLTSNEGGSSVSVLLSNGGGTFRAAVNYPTGSRPKGFEVVDINRDGYLDVLTANSGASTVSILLSNGTGAFAAPVSYSTGSNSAPFDVAVADVNLDGQPDLVTANSNYSTNSVGVLLGTSSGTFQAPLALGSGSNTYAQGIAVVDANGDGRPDLFVANTGIQYSTTGSASVLLNTTVVPAPTITSLSPTTGGAVGSTVTITGTNLNGATAVTFAGTSNNTVTTGLTVSGTGSSQTLTVAVPTGASSGNVTVTTPGGTSNGVAFTVVLPITLTLPSLPNGTVGVAYSQAFSASGGTAPYLYAITAGALPSGLTLNSGGVLSGTPSAGGSFNFSVTATDARGSAGTRAYTLTIAAPTIRLAPATLPDGTQGAAYSQVLTAAGGTAPYTFALTAGSLPAGLALASNGTLAGTPTTSGSFTFTVMATDASTGSGPYRGSRAYTLTIAPQPAPAAPVAVLPVNNSTTNSSPVFQVTATPGTVVTVYLNGPTPQTSQYPVGSNGVITAQYSGLADGLYTLYATASAQRSGAPVSAPSNTLTFTVDGTAPTVTLSSANGGSGTATSTSPLTFTATFSEAVTSLAASGLAVTNGTVSSSPTAGSGNSYTFQVTPTTPGTATTVQVRAGAVNDLVGNGNVASASYSLTYSQPVTAAPVITQPANGSTLTTRTPAIAGTAPAGSTVTIYLAMGSGAAQAIGTTTATGGSFSLVPATALADGTYAVYATAQSSGSTASASSSTNTFTVDATPPTATISSAAGSSTSTSPIPFTVSFSEPIQSFSASSVQVSNGTISSAITKVGNGYSFSVTPTAGGLVTVTLPAGAVRDQFGNANTSASALSVTYTVPITATSWTGAVSTDWFTAGNWSQGVPTASVDALIGVVSTGRYPLLSSGPATAAAQNLTISAGASLTQTGGTLSLTASLTNNGTLTTTGGTVALTGSAAQTLGGSQPLPFFNLSIGSAGASQATGVSFQGVLTLTGSLTTNGQALTLRSRVVSGQAQDGLVVNAGGVVVGAATVQRAIDPRLNPGLGYRHYSAPVSGSSVADLATTPAGGSFASVVNPAYNSSATPTAVSPFPTVYGYDQSRVATTSNNLAPFDKGYFSPTSLSDPLRVGYGYTVNLNYDQLVDFVGPLNTGDLTLNLSRNAIGTPNESNAGWQLLGNPYPAPLDYAQVDAADRPGLEAALYVYSSTGPYVGQYRTILVSPGGTPLGNPVLPVGQAFFARVARGQTSASLTFRNRQRLTAPDPTPFQRPAASSSPLVQLTLQGGGQALADEATVYFEAGASPGFEPAFDAWKLPNPTGLNLSSSLPTGQQLSIDGQPALGPAERVVPLAVGVPVAGVYSLRASQVLHLGAVPVYLRDRLLGTLTDLRQQPSYAFTVTSAAGLDTSRFELVFSPQQALATGAAALAQQVALYPNPARTQATLTLPAALAAQPVTASLLDALGRVVREQVLPAGQASHALALADLATGVYSLRLTTAAGVVVKKLVID